MEPRARILQEAEALFRLRGIRSVTMDDIASSLGMSKKTLYQYFANKAEIVYAVSEAHFNCEMELTDQDMRLGSDPIQEVLHVIASNSNRMKHIPSHMVHDVRKHYPESWALFEKFKRDYVLKVLHDNLKRGVEMGLYRKDMNIDVVALLRLAQIDSGMNDNYFPEHKFPFDVVQMEHFKLFLHGIVTLKGKRLLYQYLNLSEDE